MAVTQTTPLKLNNAQMQLLQLFQHRHMSEEELTALRRTLVQHLSNELDSTVEKEMQEQGTTAQAIEERSKEMDAHRGQYLQKIRSKK
jgi:hypothetical protein